MEDNHWFLLQGRARNTLYDLITPKLMTPRERWKIQYRNERLKRQGKPEQRPATGELSTFSGITFCDSRRKGWVSTG